MAMPSEPVLYLPWVGMLIGAGCLWGAMHALRLCRLLADTPTCKTSGVFIGLVEVKGTAEAERPLVAELSGSRCVHYAWYAQEHWSRTVTETYRDAKGKTQTRTRRESGWTRVAGGEATIPFYLQDDTGAIRIVPDGARMESLPTFSAICTPADPLYYAKAPRHAIAHSDHKRQFIESSIPLHAPLYVMGKARERKDAVAVEIAHDPDAPLYLISTRTEESIGRGKTAVAWVLAILGGSCVAGGWIAPDAILRDELDLPVLVLALGGFCAVWSLCWLWTAYNSLLRLHRCVDQAWANVDVELQRRSDLIPRLVSVVTGLRGHESSVQTQLAQLRRQLAATAPGRPGPDPQACLPRLIAIAEAYPELQSNKAFLSLQHELSRTEERIALARSYYNEVATFCNIRQRIIPDRFVAALARLTPRPLMEASGFARAPVDVTFAR